MRTISINGKRYRLKFNDHHQRVEVHGPGLTAGGWFPEGVSEDSPDAWDHLQRILEHKRQADAAFQRYLKDRRAEGIET